jgi:hypothetical protein
MISDSTDEDEEDKSDGDKDGDDKGDTFGEVPVESLELVFSVMLLRESEGTEVIADSVCVVVVVVVVGGGAVPGVIQRCDVLESDTSLLNTFLDFDCTNSFSSFFAGI